jgi:hypothetical protein
VMKEDYAKFRCEASKPSGVSPGQFARCMNLLLAVLELDEFIATGALS